MEGLGGDWGGPWGPQRVPLAAQGALGRRLWVAPSLGIVATRLGDDPRATGQGDFDRLFWKALVEAAPRQGKASKPGD